MERYSTFLALKAAHPHQTVVPTLDIDLIWHAHMLSPDDYIEDCELILGRVLPHDTGKGQGDLDEAFEETKALWRKQTGEDMVTMVPTTIDPKTGKPRSTPPSKQSSGYHGGYAGCGSCGFELGHSRLPHQHVEAAELEAAQISGEGQLAWADESVGGDNWEERGDDHMSSVENAVGGRTYTEEPDSDSGSGSSEGLFSSSSSVGSGDSDGGGWFSSSPDDSGSSDCSSCSSCGGD